MDKFFLIVIDEDRKRFTVEGPLADDQPWNSTVAAAQQDGRRIRCCNIGSTSRAMQWQSGSDTTATSTVSSEAPVISGFL